MEKDGVMKLRKLENPRVPTLPITTAPLATPKLEIGTPVGTHVA